MPARILALLLLASCLPARAQTMASLLRQLDDPDPTVQVAAVQALGQRRAREAVAPLLALCRAGSPTLRGQAAAALGRIGDRRATPAVARLLRDPFILVRMAAVAALGELRDPDAVPALLDALRDAESGIRLDAIAALGTLGDARATPELLKLLDTPDPAVREAAFAALSATRDPRAAEAFLPGLQRVEPEIRLASARALIPLAHPPARAPLLALLADDSLPVRAAAAEALGAYRDPRNADALLAAMADDDDAVRLACLKALLPLRDPRIIEPCLNILDDAPYHGDAALTLAAIEAAGRLRDARAAPLLLPLLSDRERKDEHGVEMAGHAYAALRRIGTPALIALLADIPPDVEPQRRRNAIRALGRWQHPRAMAPLLALLDDPDTSVCNAVIEALTIQHCQLYYTATLQDLLLPPREPIALSIPRAAPRAWCRDARLVDALIARLERNAGGLHELARIGTPRALDAILTEMKHPSQHRSRQAVQFLQFFDEPRATDAVFAYMAANPSRSSEVHSWLAACKNPPPLAKLEPMLRDKDSELRKAAIAALGAHREARAVPALLKIVGTDPVPEVREYCALALGLIGDTRAVPALINRLNDPVEWARSAAAWALGQIGDPRAIPALKKKAAGAEPRFAVRIGRSLAQLGDPLGAEMMAEALRSPDQMARSIAAQTVHDVPAAQRIPLLLGMIESTDGMRYSVLQAFRRVNDPAAVEALIPLLQERRAGVYVGVVEALGRTGAPQAREPLAACLTHADEVFATTAAIALVRLGDVRGLPLVRETLADPVGSLRVEALLALGDGPALFPADSDEREALCDQIAGLLTDPDPLIGALAARALGQYGDPRGADFLLAQLTTEDDAVVLGLTIPYLAALRDPRAVKPLQARLPKLPFTVRLQIVEALGAIGDPAALPMLANMSQHLDPRVREAAARGLAGQGEAARHLLTPLLRDEASRVRAAAAKSLARISAH